MSGADSRDLRGLAPLLVVAGVVTAVVFGQARGFWLSNVHNGLLALAFAFVGAYVLFQRPGHREGRLFLATGAVEAVIFLGRQLGHFPRAGESPWWGWLGVWPLAIALALTTLSVLCFPNGRLPSPRWRPVAVAVVTVAVGCAVVSALWPVEYDATGVGTAHPLNATVPDAAAALWSTLAHPAYVVFQLLWVVAVSVRWRSSRGHVRHQLSWLVAAAAVSVVALVVGLVAWDTPRPGILAATLVPGAAGWAIVHGQHRAAYSALSWLSRAGPESEDLTTDLARAVAEALSALGARLWTADGETLHAVGVWPEAAGNVAPTTLVAGHDFPDWQMRAVTRNGTVIGALSVDRAAADPLSTAETRLLDDLASQAALVLDHLGLVELVTRSRATGRVEGLTPRERDVLELMARGLSNAAICQELHLSIKTVEPVVSTIFTKLGLHPDAASNRRVLAVVAYLRT